MINKVKEELSILKLEHAKLYNSTHYANVIKHKIEVLEKLLKSPEEAKEFTIEELQSRIKTHTDKISDRTSSISTLRRDIHVSQRLLKANEDVIDSGDTINRNLYNFIHRHISDHIKHLQLLIKSEENQIAIHEQIIIDSKKELETLQSPIHRELHTIDHVYILRDMISAKFPYVELEALYDDGDYFIIVYSELTYNSEEYQSFLMDLNMNYIIKHNLSNIYFIYTGEE